MTDINSDLKLVAQIKRRYESQLLAKKNVFGCGIGYKEIGSKVTGILSIVVFVNRKVPRNRLKSRETVPVSLKDVNTDVVQLNSDKSWRQSCHVSPTFVPRYDPLCRILEPICRFKCFEEIKVGLLSKARNKVDAALVLVDDPKIAVPVILGLPILRGTKEAKLGVNVLKSGRTTGVTKGMIKAIDVSIFVEYPGKGLALFQDQIATSYMSEPGDSGSLLMDEDGYGLGLLFSGTRAFSFFNRIQNVFEALDIDGFLTTGDPQVIRKVEENYEQGKIKRTEKWRPAPGGVSIGRASQCSAATLGCYVIKDNKICILTNAHV